MASQLIIEYRVQTNMTTFVSGDVIQVVIDDVSKTVSTEKNGSTITTGDVFTPQLFRDEYFTRTETGYRYCAGEDLIYFTPRVTFPYYNLLKKENSAQCQTTANDMQKVGPPVVTPATSKTTHDGEVTIKVFSEANVKFWPKPFAHAKTGYAADSVSNNVYTYTFLNLAPGPRKFYAANANGHNVEYEINVPVDKNATYGSKYYFDFPDRHNELYRIDLKRRAYSGSSTEFDNMAMSPLELQPGVTRAGGNKFSDLITTTKINVNLKATSDEQWVTEFSSIDEKSVLCEISKTPVDYLNGTGNYFTTSGIDFSSATSANLKVKLKSENTTNNQFVLITGRTTNTNDYAGIFLDGNSGTNDARVNGGGTVVLDNFLIDDTDYAGDTWDNKHDAALDGDWHTVELKGVDMSYYDSGNFNGYSATAWREQISFEYIWLDLDNDGIYEYKWDGQGRAINNHSDLTRTGTPSVTFRDLVYTGFNLVDQYIEPYKNAPYSVTIPFSDGLEDLSLEPYTIDRKVKDDIDPSEVRLDPITITGKSTLLEVISFCLRKTLIGSNIRSLLSYYPDASAPAVTDDPLTFVKVDNEIFYEDNGTPKTCLEVLEMCLKMQPEVGKISGGGGYWWIEPVEITGAMDYREYDQYGTYSTNSYVNPMIEFIQAADIRASAEGGLVRAAGQLSFDRTYQKIRIVKNRRIRQNLFGQFRESNRTTGEDPSQLFNGWTGISNGDDVSWEAIKLNEEGEYAIQYNSVDGQGCNNFIIATTEITYQSSDEFEIKWKVFFDPVNYMTIENTLPYYVPVRYVIKVGAYYWTHNGTWTTTFTINEKWLETFRGEVEFTAGGHFREDIVATTDNIEFRLYDADVLFHDYTATGANLAALETDVESTVEAISTTNLGDGNRFILRGDDTSQSTYYYNYYYTLRTSDETADGVSIITATDNSNFKWALDRVVKVQQTPYLGFQTKYYTTEPKLITYPNGNKIEERELVDRQLKPGNARILEIDLPAFGVPDNINNAKRLIKNIFYNASDATFKNWIQYKKVDFLNGVGNYYTTSGIDFSGASSASVKVGLKSSDAALLMGADSVDGIGYGAVWQNGSGSACLHSTSSNLIIDGALYAASPSDKTRNNLHDDYADGQWHDFEWTQNMSAFNGQFTLNDYQPIPAVWQNEVYFSYFWLDLDNDGIYEYKWDGCGRALENHADLVRTGTPSYSMDDLDGVAKRIDQIQLDNIARHYQLPRRRLSIEGISNGDFLPYKGMRDNEDNLRVYIFDQFGIDIKTQKFRAELVEIYSETTTSIGGFKSTAFSSGFRRS